MSKGKRARRGPNSHTHKADCFCHGVFASLGRGKRITPLAIPQQIRKQPRWHSGSNVTENCTHTFTQNERVAAEKLGEFFGTGWPEIDKGKVISFPSLPQKKKGLLGASKKPLCMS